MSRSTVLFRWMVVGTAAVAVSVAAYGSTGPTPAQVGLRSDPGACCYSDGQCRVLPPEKCAALVGDTDCDGDVDFGDINPFVQLLSGGTMPDCAWASGDCNRDGAVSLDDINPFVSILSQGLLFTAEFIGPGIACDPHPCPCPLGAYDEGELCYTDTNGGCGSIPPVYGLVGCDATVCGTSYYDGTWRDTDWYRIDIWAGLVTYLVTVQAEFDVQVMFIRDDWEDCANLEIEYAEGAAGQEVVLATEVHPSSAADYICIAPQFTTPFDCGGDQFHYWFIVECFAVDYPPGACCLDGVCYDYLTIWECADSGGTWMGYEVPCTPDLCARSAPPR